MYFGIHRSTYTNVYLWCESTSSVGGKCLDAAYRLKKNKSKHACHYNLVQNNFDVSWLS